ncbi:hypothetical protein OsI_01445 [Oryza sativa Indica Group]|uniref:Uncharacterized protein n=1 Tax=Oryza sativa subsp. indica TaxID=39946 RepID=A2WNL3_ORYSI|nr:hypothetical protein OsI_01445 [Oryza sativa Indica Group]
MAGAAADRRRAPLPFPHIPAAGAGGGPTSRSRSQFSRLGEVFALSLAWVYARIQFYCRNIDGENIDIASMFRLQIHLILQYLQAATSYGHLYQFLFDIPSLNMQDWSYTVIFVPLHLSI